MKIKEIIHKVIFVLVVAGATVLLNLPHEKGKVNETNQLKEQLNYSAVNFKETHSILKLNEKSIEVEGDLEIKIVQENEGIMFLWNKIGNGEKKYKILLNNVLYKIIKSRGQELFCVINKSKFNSGENKLSISALDDNKKKVKGELYLSFSEFSEQEISFSE